jgi:putative ABC transport system ATP-binding protein
MNTDVIRMNDIKKSYGEGTARVNVLNGVSLTVKKGEFVAVLGPSGSGKTTLMNIIGLIDTHDEGKYVLDGEDIEDKDENEYSEIRNRKIGFVFQKFNLIAKYTALYNVALPLLLRGIDREPAEETAEKILERVGLADRKRNTPLELSGGQQQRVAIARALVGEANIILADEPTGALDTKTGQEIVDLLISLNKTGKTIVLITHDINIAKQAGRIIHVQDGLIFENPTIANELLVQ